MAALIAAGARLSFPLPFTDVPVSLQVFFVLLAGGLLGARWGAMSVAEYLLAGAAGAPVFAQGFAGPAVFAGPDGGYLVGFLAAAAFIGYFSDRRANRWAMAGAVWAGSLLILLCGASWLHFGHHRPWAMAFEMGVLPFLAADALKALTAWAVIWRAKG
jgi:biotin transport system substrate-specific component